MEMIKKLTLTGCTLLLLAGCGTNTSTENVDTLNQLDTAAYQTKTSNLTNVNYKSNSSTGNEANTFDIKSPKVSLSEALGIFNEVYPNAKIESVDLEIGYGQLYYEIDGFDSAKEYELKIDATTKEIYQNEVKRMKGTEEVLDFSSVMNPKEAIEIASQIPDVQGLAPIGWSLDAEYGMQIYKVEFRDSYTEIEVKINANTGEILEVEVDD